MMMHRIGRNSKIPKDESISIIRKQPNQLGINQLFSPMLSVQELLSTEFPILLFCSISDLQNQLEHVNKTIHESEKEVKRLENEQSQASASAANDKAAQPQQQPPQVTPTPAFLNGFTLEKMDNNDIRRLVISILKIIFAFFEIELCFYSG